VRRDLPGEAVDAVRVDGRALRVLRAYAALPYEEAGRIRVDGELALGLERLMHEFVRVQAEREIGTAGFVAESRRVSLVSWSTVDWLTERS
jgi:hypothetical protein